MTIAGVALSAGGIAANSIASSQTEAATNRALVAERQRQAQYQAEASRVQEQSRARYDGFSEQQGQRQDNLSDYLKGQTVQPAATVANAGGIPASSSNITVQEETAQRGKADAYASSQADALAAKNSFGDLLGTISRGQARDAGEIGQIGGFMRGSSGVVPLELNAASHAGDGWKTIGSLASGVGKLGIAGGLSGALGGTASAAAGLPTLGGSAAMGAPTIADAVARMPSAPLTLGTVASSLPAFARGGTNSYSVF